MYKFFLVFLFQLLFALSCYADHNYYLFEQANLLYEQEKYAASIDKYEEVLQNGYESWELYYNLGNAYYKNRELGKAILNYERAQKLASKNEDVKFNLEIANLAVVDKIVTPPDFFFFKIFSDFENYFSLNMTALFVIVSYFVIIILICLRILVRKKEIRGLTTVLGIPLLIFLIIFTSILIIKIDKNNNLNFGIILVDKVDVVSSPEEKGTELFSLHEGVKVQTQKNVADWIQIRLSDGKVGWVKKNVLEVI